MKILIAEDDLLSRTLLESALGELGHQVVAAANGREAWDLFQREPIEVLITDYYMPELDGLQLSQLVRKKQSSAYVYIIMFTTDCEGQKYVEAVDAGVDELLTKPFDEVLLGARLKAADRILSFKAAKNT